MRLEYAAGERMSVDSQLLDVAPDIFNNHRIDLQAMLESQTQNDITDITGPQWPPPTEGGCRRGPTGPTLDSASCPPKERRRARGRGTRPDPCTCNRDHAPTHTSAR